MNCAVVFGGTGFIGVSFALQLLRSEMVDKVYLFDIESPSEKSSEYRKQLVSSESRISYIRGDVRYRIEEFCPAEVVSLIANFAAIHREPGHEDREYYETNMLGAENVVAWAEKVDCNQIIFTSSISPYGVSEDVKDELSLPIPTTAYGSSKLVAENIHRIWQARNDLTRRLVIARPGVVFGPGEGGNVSRLISAVLNRYFFYTGNRNTRKSGIYVKELCNAMIWVLDEKDTSVKMLNMSMNPGPSIEEYVLAICKVANVRRRVANVPIVLLLFLSYFIDLLAKLLGIKHPFSPVRIRKLVRSNNVLPTYLVDNGYQYLYTLEEALVDWSKECPDEWK
jgi:nucleoside-diphosphate-sugar epimerase